MSTRTMFDLTDLSNYTETLWLNPHLESVAPHFELNGKKFLHIKAAQNRLMRFMPYIEEVFPETAPRRGIIESELIEIPQMKDACFTPGQGADASDASASSVSDISASSVSDISAPSGSDISASSVSDISASSASKASSARFSGRLFLKDDAHLPIAGSVKARGGIHEILKVAEGLALKEGLITPTDSRSLLNSDEARAFFGQYTIQVGSTGNLGLSIGIMSAKLGFKVIVHMSSDAKQWKKDMLRSYGVDVREYDDDYSAAVAEGRKLSDEDSKSHFVDDEASEDLFFGYATAALRLRVQLSKAGIAVDESHPLFVYLPCGVGGAPGGIAFGLKQLFGDNVNCFFAEPTHAPCFTLGMATEKYNNISVYDIGLDGRTLADGLAVGRPSGFVCSMMKTLVSGSYTVSDERLLEYQKLLFDRTGIYLEPSACAGFAGPQMLTYLGSGRENLKYNRLISSISEAFYNATHIIWATGGGLVPEDIR